MKRVCILTSAHSPFDARIFHKQAKSLVKAGYDVTLIAQHDEDEIVDGIKVVALPRARNRLHRMTGTWRVFRLARRQKADIYHFHDPELLPWGWLLQKLSGKPVIYDVHENYADTVIFKPWLPHLLRKPVAWIFDIIEKTLASGLSAIITVTEPMKEEFAGCRVTCVSVYNFPALEILGSGENVEADIKSDQYSIIYTGSIARAKGFETILDALDLAIRQNPEVTCLILAETDNMEWLGAERKSVMKRLIKDGNLKIMGRVPHSEVFRYLKASSIGWRPGPPYQEGISTKILEYMACRKPVVSSDVSLTADIIREFKCGILVDPYDASAHAHAILYLLEHPAEARRMGENGRKAVMEKYNWESESKKLIDVYRLLCQ